MRTVRLPRKCLNRINPCNICTCSRLRARGECGGSLKIINRLGRVHNNLRAHRQSHHCGRHVNAAKSSKSLSFPPWHTHIIIPWELISGWWLLALGISVCVVWGYIGNIRLDIFSAQASHFTLDNQFLFLFYDILILLPRAEIWNVILRQLSFYILFMFYVGTNSELKWDTLHSVLIPSPAPTYLSCAPDNPWDLSTSLIWLLGFGNIATLPQTQTVCHIHHQNFLSRTFQSSDNFERKLYEW